MFERYTEAARRVIFFGRYEASTYGSRRAIETEHLLLGLLREDKKLLERLLERPDVDEDVRARIKSRITTREKTTTSIDIPLSDECKRILAYANEESERLHHRLIGTEHLFLGILRENECLASQVLSDAGISLDAAREAVAQSLPAEGPVPTYLHPPADHFRELADKFLTEERASSFRRAQDGSLVVETLQSVGSHQVSVREQFQLSSDGKKLRYTHEVTGPRPEQRYAHSYDFDVSPNS